jgi:hypothetical protein
MKSTIQLLRRAAVSAAALAALSVPLAAATAPGIASASSTANTALINEESVTTSDGIKKGETPISLEQFAAENAGFSVTVVSGSAWEAMTAAEFAKYQVLIVGDPNCGDTAVSANSNAGTWAPVVMSSSGNRTLIGTDPEDHYQYGEGGASPTNPAEPATAGAEHLVQDSIAFAGAIPGATGVSYDTSCDDPGTDISVLDQLTTTGAGHWEENTNPPCGGSVQQIASNPAFETGPTALTDGDIQGWECSDHITFPAFPTDWNALAVATDTLTTPTCGTDPTTKETACGQAYVLVSGTGVIATSPNLTLEPATHSDTAGGTHAVTATVVQETQPIYGARSASVRPMIVTPEPVGGAVVSFAVSGQNSGVSGTCTYPGGEADPECKTNSSGQVVFTYPDTNGVGSDTINAAVTLAGSVQHATAEETWTAAPVVVTPTSTPTPTPTVPPPAGAVLGTKETAPAKGSAHIAGVRGCVAQTGYVASVRGSSIAYVTFTLDGHRITLRTPSHGAFALRFHPGAGSKHHLTFHVVFTASSKTPSKTIHQTLARCAARTVSPRFTG